MIQVFLAKYLVLVFPLFLGYLLFKKEYRTVFLAALSGLAAKLLEVIVGFFYYTPRPFVVNPKLPFYDKGQSFLLKIVGDSNLANDSSFFSAHAATSFAVATVVYLTYKKRYGRILLIIAGLVSIGRVLANLHYPVDIIAGAIIGTIVALTISNLCAKLLIK